MHDTSGCDCVVLLGAHTVLIGPLHAFGELGPMPIAKQARPAGVSFDVDALRFLATVGFRFAP